MTSTEPKEMRVAQVNEAKGPLQIVKRPIPTPGPGQVLVKIEACGVCHTDAVMIEGHFGATFPRVPGHEAIGRVAQLGEGVTSLTLNQRVGFGFNAHFCGSCPSCRRGDFAVCSKPLFSGISIDGGYAEYAIAYEDGLVRIPDGIPSDEAAPLMCAGLTVYNSIRHSDAKPGDLVAVQGIGGLGHLAIQYCKKMGFLTAAISGGADKQKLATELGADLYFDYKSVDASQELQKLGGAKVIVATSSDAKSVSALVSGLSVNGTLLVLGVTTEPITANSGALIMGRRKILGWPSGQPTDTEDTVKFSLQTGVKAMIEKFPLEKAQEAYDRMIQNKARFRTVIVMDH